MQTKILFEEKAKLLKQMKELIAKDSWTESTDKEFQDMLRQVEKINAELEVISAENEHLADTLSPEYQDFQKKKRIFAKDERLTKEKLPLSMGGFLSAIVNGPQNELEERYYARALSAGSGSGSFGVPTLIGDMIWDQLRDQSVVFQAGAKVIRLDTLTTNFSKITADSAQDGWVAENTTLTPGDPTITAVSFTAKTYAQMITASVQCVSDSANIGDVLNMYFMNKFQEAVESAMLVGAGGNEPTGVYNFSGLSTTLSALGSELGDYTDLIYARGNLERDGARVTAYITSPEVKRDLDALTDSTGQTIARPPELAPIYSTKAIPANVTYGGYTNTSSVLLGDWSKLYLGIRSDINVTVLKERYMNALQYGFLGTVRADVQASHEEAFGRIVAIGAASGAPTT